MDSVQNYMALQLLQTGQLEAALRIFRKALARDPLDVDANLGIGQACVRSGDPDAAAAAYRRALSGEPGDTGACSRIGRALQSLGQFDDARTAFLRALRLSPDDVEIWLQLALITDFGEHPDLLAQLRHRHATLPAGDPRRRPLAFALGDALDSAADYDAAFEYFREANRIARGELHFSLDEHRAFFAAIKAAYDTEFFERFANQGLHDSRAIFLIGLARSGSTLIEQILASHPLVHGAGEVDHLLQIVVSMEQASGGTYPGVLKHLEPGICRRHFESYLRRQQAVSGNRPYTTDKQLSNFLYIGLIAAMLPNATIVHCRRDPRDQLLSYFMKDMGRGGGHHWSYDLEELTGYYLLYEDMMAYWQRVLPNRMTAFDYEDVVADPDTQVRALLDKCGLGFDPACLAFYENPRVVSTLSRAQVRKPIYQNSVGRWKNYERGLEPMLMRLAGRPAGDAD